MSGGDPPRPPAGRDALGRLASALLVGAALGIALEVGAALMLYTGLGLLSATGFIVGVALAALAAGVWVGAPDGASARRPHGVILPSGGRWTAAASALLLAAVFATFWEHLPGLRTAAGGRALGLLLMVAWPVYSLGALLATLAARARAAAARAGTSVVVAALAGAALGVTWAGVVLIRRYPAGYVLGGCDLALLLAAVWESGRRLRGAERSEAMQGMTAVVTGVGAPGQLGYAIARAILEAGGRVLVTGHGPAVEELARQLAADGGGVAAVQADLTSEEGAQAVASAARELLGRLDLLVNAAGGLSLIRPLAETGAQDWARELDRNARTTFLMCRAALPLLRESRGAIVNFASPAGLRAVASLGAYSAAKAAVVALTRALALEEAPHGVRVNALAPGMVDTEQNRRTATDPAGVRWVSREQVAALVLYLASPAAAAITGETIELRGGVAPGPGPAPAPGPEPGSTPD